jgi:hypothetical protein
VRVIAVGWGVGGGAYVDCGQRFGQRHLALLGERAHLQQRSFRGLLDLWERRTPEVASEARLLLTRLGGQRTLVCLQQARQSCSSSMRVHLLGGGCNRETPRA